jgi:hypothetical protein
MVAEQKKNTFINLFLSFKVKQSIAGVERGDIFYIQEFGDG